MLHRKLMQCALKEKRWKAGLRFLQEEASRLLFEYQSLFYNGWRMAVFPPSASSVADR